MITLKDFIKNASDDELATFLAIVMVTAIKSQGLDISGINIDYEKVEFRKMLNNPMPDSLKESIMMFKNSSKPLS